jgi:hypothetical protein
MDKLTANRITSAHRRGSSRPVIVETDRGLRLLKLRGAGQGTEPLVAEIIVAELARALGLLVPAQSLVTLPARIETANWDDELAVLLERSVGLNLGFAYLEGTREISAADAAAVPSGVRASILWFDRLVMNPDRTASNPNLLREVDRIWLIDHGAALGFHYNWAALTEDLPRRAPVMPDAHLFDPHVAAEELIEVDARLAPLLTRDVLEEAVHLVPDSFLGADSADQRRRRRAAYSAFLWKRLRPPRPFLLSRQAIAARTVRRPGWLTRRR